MEIIKGRRYEGLYVHVPYCIGKCAYCDFYSVRIEEAPARAYLNALGSEARFLAPGPPDTVYVGGGTPTSLPAPMLSSLLEIVTEITHEAREFTVEANPGTLDDEKLGILKRSGVTRMSLGVQSLNDPELRSLGRLHTAKDALRAALMIKDHGLHLSVDLMYGLPGQAMRDWERTLGRVLELRPSHVSAYELTPAEGTPLWDAIEGGSVAMPSEDLVTDMFHRGRELLTAEGYGHYEVSNYALPGMECRHNLNYWRRGSFLGLGPGAHSFDGTARWWNVEDTDAYVRMLGEGIQPVAERHELSEADALREEVMLGLRTSEGLELARFQNEHGLDLSAACAPLIREGMIVERAGRVALTPDALMLMNPVTVRLFVALGL